jgi:hypothetical protein
MLKKHQSTILQQCPAEGSARNQQVRHQRNRRPGLVVTEDSFTALVKRLLRERPSALPFNGPPPDDSLLKPTTRAT